MFYKRIFKFNLYIIIFNFEQTKQKSKMVHINKTEKFITIIDLKYKRWKPRFFYLN